MGYASFISWSDPVFSSLKENSQNTYSVLTWNYNHGDFKLYPEHIIQSDSDSDYYYELYYTVNYESSANPTNRVACIRYRKEPQRNDTDIYMHDMLYSDFTGVFGGNLKNSNIYSWHGNDNVLNYYWHAYSDEPLATDWRIEDGNLPFLIIFPQMYTVNEPLASFWNIIDGALPFRPSFPQMYTVDDAPLSFWRIKDGDLPYRLAFPKMYPYGYTGNKLYKGNRLIKKIYLGNTKIKAVYNGDTKIF